MASLNDHSDLVAGPTADDKSDGNGHALASTEQLERGDALYADCQMLRSSATKLILAAGIDCVPAQKRLYLHDAGQTTFQVTQWARRRLGVSAVWDCVFNHLLSVS